ncbi:hypothetical protein ABTJ81_19755, partial [Acinetobacter baumannii]
TADDIRFLRRAGFRVEIDRTATARMREAERALASGVGIASSPGYPATARSRRATPRWTRWPRRIRTWRA